MDQIQIRGLKLFAYHGVNPEEKQNGQNFELDVTLFTSVKRPGCTDDLNDTINYSKAVKCITRVMAEGPYDLIERAATRVAQQLLIEFPPVEQVTVRLKKPEAPIKADFDFVAVDITRTREDFHD